MRRRLNRSAVIAFYWWAVHFLRFVLWVVGRWKVEGRDNVPRHGAFILVSNHLNNADPPILASAVRHRRVRYMAKVELFKPPFGFITRLYGAFPVRRFEADAPAVLNAMRILRDGGAVGMFPEGTRSKTGALGEPHPGTAVIAMRAGIPILPCAITGTERLRNPLVVFRKPRITVRIGRPIPVEAVRRPSEAEIERVTTQIFTAIRELLPASYAAPYTEEEASAPAADG